MANRRTRAHEPVAAGVHDPQQASRTLGVVALCGAMLALLHFVVTDDQRVSATGLYMAGAAAGLIGIAGIVWAKHARPWTVHAMFAAGTGLVCLGAYLSDMATGAYAFLLVWLVLMAASFFSARAILAHLLWILAASAVTIRVVETSDVSAFTRWAFGSFLLIVAAVLMGRIVAGRRAVEDQLREEIDERARLQRELEHLAHHDPLTGLPNRRAFEEQLKRELDRASRTGAALAVAALDLDGFKEYNDARGHVAGDRFLKSLAGAWTTTLRSIDVLARLGGDEFVAILPDCPMEEAERVVSRLRDRIPAGLTCSAGTACWDGSESAEQLYARADGAMYAAKERSQALAAASRS